MGEVVHPPFGEQDSLEQSKKLAAELVGPDPITEYAQALPAKPSRDATNKEKDAYKRDERWLHNAAAELYENDLEGAVVMRDLTQFLRSQSTVDNPGGDHHEKMARVRDLTEYQFLLAHFVLQRSGDEAYMRQFWQSAQEVAQKAGKSGEEIMRLRVGVLSTVATIKALDALGYEPELAHPDQDAYETIDVRTGGHQALQIKAGGSQLEVYRTDMVDYPAVRLEAQGQPVKMISTGSAERLDRDLKKFATNVDKVQAREGRPVEGLFVRMPYMRINQVTGEPQPELLEELRQKLNHSEQDLPMVA